MKIQEEVRCGCGVVSTFFGEGGTKHELVCKHGIITLPTEVYCNEAPFCGSPVVFIGWMLIAMLMGCVLAMLTISGLK